jgi:hypothetical protein
MGKFWMDEYPKFLRDMKKYVKKIKNGSQNQEKK